MNPIRILLSTWAIFIIAVKRITSQKGLALASLVGLVFSIALTTSIPAYTDAVYFRLFNLSLSLDQATAQSQPQQSLFSLLFSYQEDANQLKRWMEIEPVSQYLSKSTAGQIGLPLKQVIRYFNSETLGLFPSNANNFSDNNTRLGHFSFSTLSALDQHITILQGTMPVANTGPEQPVEVLISEHMAGKYGIQVGESYIAFGRFVMPDGNQPVTVQIPVKIAGIWKPNNPNEYYWFVQINFLEERFLVPETVFTQQVSGYLPGLVYAGMWNIQLDASHVTYGDADSLASRIMAVQQQAVELLPNVKLRQSPLVALSNYHSNSVLLTVQLYAFSLPILALLLAFISMMAGLSVEQRRNEIAVFRSRGATTLQIIGIAVLEGLILGALGLALSLPISLVIARWIGQVRTFLDFNSLSNLTVRLTTTSLEYGLMAVGLALISQVLPTINAAQHTITTYKQERSRMLRGPWWQRAWLDVLLFIPTGYGAYLLSQQGSVALVENRNPFENPLLFLIPALCIFALSLSFLRIMPYLIAIVAWISARIGSVGLLMASWQLARTPSYYITPLMLLILTLSLSAFTSSLAVTVDRHLFDQTYYAEGCDLKFLDLGAAPTSNSNYSPGGGQRSTVNTSAQDSNSLVWVFLPVQDYLKIPGITHTARVGRYQADVILQGNEVEATYLGVDRYDFPLVSFWRSDFSSTNLGDLMNYLAMFNDGALIPQDYVEQTGMKVGDSLQVTVSMYGEKTKLTLKIVGGFKYFPSWYPSTGPLIVGNLDYLFQSAGGMFPYQVWLKTNPGLDLTQLQKNNSSPDGSVKVSNVYIESAQSLIEGEQSKPQRQGLFGVLSVGFFAAALLTVLGFLLYALFSFRRRFIELGVLRAIGLSYMQMVSYLAWELAFLVLMGMGAGTAFGVGAASWFIPSFQLGYGEAAHIPPYLVQISWPAVFRIYLLFGILFVLALIVLVYMLQRMKIFQAIKLGETV